MFEAYAIGMLGIPLLALTWVGVQRAWGRVFPDAFEDSDVLAERTGCGACTCINPCERRRLGDAAANRSSTTEDLS